VRVRVTEGEMRAAACVPAHVRAVEACYGDVADRLTAKYTHARERNPELAKRPPPMRRL